MPPRHQPVKVNHPRPTTLLLQLKQLRNRLHAKNNQQSVVFEFDGPTSGKVRASKVCQGMA